MSDCASCAEKDRHITSLQAANTREVGARHAAEKVAEGLTAALRAIVDLEPSPFVMPSDWRAQIAACSECQGWAKDHPIQRGICNTHRKPLWARERHDAGEVSAIGSRAKEIARAHLAEAKD